MARNDGVAAASVADEYTARVLGGQAKVWGALWRRA
jgi:hypothetical protein